MTKAELELDERAQELKAWLGGFVNQFRIETEKLTAEEKEALKYDDNFCAPCQIEVVSTQDPEYQVVIISKLEDWPDQLFEIHDAVKTWGIVELCQRMLAERRWNESIPPTAVLTQKRLKSAKVLRDALETPIVMAIWTMQREVLAREQRPFLAIRQNALRTPDIVIWLVVGNLADMDQKNLVNEILGRVKSNAAFIKRESEEHGTSSEQPRLVKGYSATFFPHVAIGSIPRAVNLEDRIYRTYLEDWMYENAISVDYAGGHLAIRRDGSIILTVPEKSRARRAINLICGVSSLLGVPLYSIRDSELGECQVDPTDWHLQIGGGGSLYRSKLVENPWFLDRASLMGRIKISNEKFGEIISKSKVIFGNPDKANQVVLLLQATSFRKESDGSQAFITAWLIIERHFSNLWRQYLTEKGLNSRRRKSLELGSFARICEDLSLLGLINDPTYELLVRFRNLRNDYVHNAIEVPSSEVEEAIKMAESITRESLTGII